MDNYAENPIVHIESLSGPRAKLNIIGTSEGLKALLFATADAIGKDGHGLAQLFCKDAEAYELHILRQDCQESWEEISLPYQSEEAWNPEFIRSEQ